MLASSMLASSMLASSMLASPMLASPSVAVDAGALAIQEAGGFGGFQPGPWLNITVGLGT